LSVTRIKQNRKNKTKTDEQLSLEIVITQCSAIAEELNIGSKSAISLQTGAGRVDPKFQVEGIVPHQPFSSE